MTPRRGRIWAPGLPRSPKNDHRMATPISSQTGLDFMRLPPPPADKNELERLERMSVTPRECGPLKALSHHKARALAAEFPARWSARSTLMFLVGATGLIWAGVVYSAIRFL